MLVFQGIDLINNPSLLDNAKSREKIKVLCDYSKCKGGKCITKHHVQTKLRRRRNGNMSGLYCSQDCAALARRTITIVPCAECKTPVRRQRHIRSRSDRRFCNSSCAASYNNKHKTHGYRRSKLEEHLEECLRAEYPNLELLCNNKEVIGSELDFYFPQLRLAIELNGIFHYEPIYGQEKLEKIQANDKQKMRRCLEEGIEFCTVDSSSCKRLTENQKEKYFNIFKQIIEPLLGRADL